MRFLFCTLQFDESDFYGRVGRELERRGHEVTHVAYSRRSARRLRGHCLPEEMARLGPLDVDAEAKRIERTYDTPSLRDVYLTDWPLKGSITWGRGWRRARSELSKSGTGRKGRPMAAARKRWTTR